MRIAHRDIEIAAGDIEAACARISPEPQHQHWVEVGTRRWPPKQVVAVALGLARSEFTAHTALRILRRLGFRTSDWPGQARGTSSHALETPRGHDPALDELAEASRTLGAFLRDENLTSRLARLENDLRDADGERSGPLVSHA